LRRKYQKKLCIFERLIRNHTITDIQTNKSTHRNEQPDLDASSLFEILPDFHNLTYRLGKFMKTVLCDPAGRVREVENEIAFVKARSDEMHTLSILGAKGQIPLHVTHNDTKFNNILFNPDNKAISVVDLDTVMPGYVLYDVGDAIRIGASTTDSPLITCNGQEHNSDCLKAWNNIMMRYRKSSATTRVNTVHIFNLMN
jgi:thiamine kinase-like enzyme